MDDLIGKNSLLDEETGDPADAINAFMHQSGMDSVKSPAPLPQPQEDAEYWHQRIRVDAYMEYFLNGGRK